MVQTTNTNFLNYYHNSKKKQAPPEGQIVIKSSGKFLKKGAIISHTQRGRGLPPPNPSGVQGLNVAGSEVIIIDENENIQSRLPASPSLDAFFFIKKSIKKRGGGVGFR